MKSCQEVRCDYFWRRIRSQTGWKLKEALPCEGKRVENLEAETEYDSTEPLFEMLQ